MHFFGRFGLKLSRKFYFLSRIFPNSLNRLENYGRFRPKPSTTNSGRFGLKSSITSYGQFGPKPSVTYYGRFKETVQNWFWMVWAKLFGIVTVWPKLSRTQFSDILSWTV
jgi:hypothetical protein